MTAEGAGLLAVTVAAPPGQGGAGMWGGSTTGGEGRARTALGTEPAAGSGPADQGGGAGLAVVPA